MRAGSHNPIPLTPAAGLSLERVHLYDLIPKSSQLVEPLSTAVFWGRITVMSGPAHT